MAQIISVAAATPGLGLVPPGVRYQINPGGGTTGPSGAQSFSGMSVTPWIDAGACTDVIGQLDIDKTVPAGLTALTNMAAGSFQIEISTDGNGGKVLASPVSIAQNAAGSVLLPTTAAGMPKLTRYIKYRFVPTSAVTVEGTLQTAPTALQGVCQSIAFSSDGLMCACGGATSTYLDGFPITQANPIFGTKTAGTALGAAPNQVAFCPTLPANGAGGNSYYLASATGSTVVITPMTAPLGTFGTNTASGTLAGTQKSVSWHPGIAAGNQRANGLTAGASIPFVGVPAGLFLCTGGTGSPYVTIFAFNPVTGVLGQAQTLSNLPAVGNVTCVRFSPDGNFLLVGGATSPYITVLPVIITGSAAAGYSLNLDKAITQPRSLPNAAILSCLWHPTMEQIFALTGTSTYLFGWSFWFNTNGTYFQNMATPQYAAFGPKVAMPTPGGAPTTFPDSLAISPDGAWLAVGDALTTYLHNVYSIGDPGTGVGAAATTVAPGSTTGAALAFHPNGQTIAIGGATSPFLGSAPWIVGVDMAMTVQGYNTP